MLDKAMIRENFSRSAPDYDRHAVLQRGMAAALLASLPAVKPQKILDLGCGTGELTARLAGLFPKAEVVGLDIAPGMIDAAKKLERANLRFLVGDGEEVGGVKEWDLIVANASLQWMDAPRAIKGAARLLKPKGVFAFTTFGPQTLIELRTSGFRVNDFPAVEELQGLAAPLFTQTVINSRNALRRFSSLKELIFYLKELGANTAAPRRTDLAAFRRFRENHPQVTATFEIVSGLLFK
jgi:malonyl-CoA O-methyltransferase